MNASAGSRIGAWCLAACVLAAAAAAEPTGADQGAVKGLAEFRKGDTLVVGGQRIRLVEKTKIKGIPKGESVPLGYQVHAKGNWRTDGSLEARQLEAKPNPRDAKEDELLAKCREIEALYARARRVVRIDGDGDAVTLGPISEDGPLHRRARGILDRLVPPYVEREEVRLYIVGNSEWNAFAMANFAIYVHSGLLEDLDDDEIAIVLGHELAHATLEHTRRSMGKSRWARLAGGITSIGGAVLAIAGGDALAELGGDALQTVGGLGANALSNGFSRGFEDEADRVGLRYAYEGGFDVQRAPALWRRFGDQYKDQSGVKNFLFGSHSQSKDRAKNMEAEVGKNYASGLDTPSNPAPPANAGAGQRDGRGKKTKRAP